MISNPRQRKTVACFEQPIELDGLRRRTDVTGSVNGVLVVQCRTPFAKLQRRLKQFLLQPGSRDFRSLAIDDADPLTELPMVIREQNPFDVFDAVLLQFIEHAAIAKIDEQGRIAVSQHIGVACISMNEDVGDALRRQRELLCTMNPPRPDWNTTRTEKTATTSGLFMGNIAFVLVEVLRRTTEPESASYPDQWLETTAKRTVRPATCVFYETECAIH